MNEPAKGQRRRFFRMSAALGARAGLLAGALLGAGQQCRAADSQPTPMPAAAPHRIATTVAHDEQDVYVLARSRPILLRLHVQRAGSSYQAAWGRKLWEMFQHADQNQDRVLDEDELLSLSPDQAFAGRRDGFGQQRGQALSFLEFDTRPLDGQISLAEFTSTLGTLCFAVSSSNRSGLGADLLSALVNRDGVEGVSRADATGVAALLRPLDTNDDETIDFQELRPDADPRRGGQPLLFGYTPPTPPRSGIVSTLLAPLTSSAESRYELARALFAYYDQPAANAAQAANPGSNGESPVETKNSPATAGLTAQELAIPADQFAAVDADQSGALSVDEFTGWCANLAPDAELVIQLGPRELPFDQQITCLAQSPAFTLTYGESNNRRLAVLTSDRVRLEVTSYADLSLRDLREAVEREFVQLDGDKNEYLDENELRDRATFATADADHNGMIFLAELVSYREQTVLLGTSIASASLSDQGSTLSDVLDTDNDRRLSARELGRLSHYAMEWDRNQDGQLLGEEVPQNLQLSVGFRQNVRPFNVTFGVLSATINRVMPAVEGPGPEWFRRMDRNLDGDVSRREFLGPLEMFEQADADHDGLLSAEEAAQIE